MNKPKIKDTVLYTHPFLGEVTLFNILEMLKYASEKTKQFENITLDLLKQNGIFDDLYYNLFNLLSSTDILELINDIESNID